MSADIFYVNSRGDIAPRLKQAAGWSAAVVASSLIVLGACSSLSKTVSGDWSCKAPGGSCAPTQNIDDRALSRVGGAITPTVAAPGSYITPLEGRILVSGQSVRRSADRVLKITFPGRESPTGVRYQPTVAHVVVERGDWQVQQASLRPQRAVSAPGTADPGQSSRRDAVPDAPSSTSSSPTDQEASKQQSETHQNLSMSSLPNDMDQIAYRAVPNLSAAMIAGQQAQAAARAMPVISDISQEALASPESSVADPKPIVRKHNRAKRHYARQHKRIRTTSTRPVSQVEGATCGQGQHTVSVCVTPAEVASSPRQSAGRQSVDANQALLPSSLKQTASVPGTTETANRSIVAARTDIVDPPRSLASSTEKPASSSASSATTATQTLDPAVAAARLQQQISPVIEQLRRDAGKRKLGASDLSTAASGAE